VVSASRKSLLRRIVVGDGGSGVLVGTLVFLAAGLGLVYISAVDLREAMRPAPVAMTCEEWLREPARARWVTLTGCRLDLTAAVARQWKGWVARRDGGIADRRNLEMFMPVVADAAEITEDSPAAVVATTDKELLKLMDDLAKLPVEEVDAFLAEHRATIESKVAPAELTGYVEAVTSTESRAALRMMLAEGTIVLEQNRAPRRANAFFGALLGFCALVWALLPIVRRILLVIQDRPSAGDRPGADSEHE
jgi:hypothetical protein